MKTDFEVKELTERVASLTMVPGTAGKPPTLDIPGLDRLEKALDGNRRSLRPRILLTAQPPKPAKYFCVGADIGALRFLDRSNIEEWIARGHRVFDRLEDFPAPTVARVQGYALGGRTGAGPGVRLYLRQRFRPVWPNRGALGFCRRLGGHLAAHPPTGPGPGEGAFLHRGG